jgi:Ca-activated chloride channel homolog
MKTSDELHRARKAFETERATHPDAAARERAIGLAMQAFDRKNQTIGQEMRSGERLNQRNDNALWRRIMSHFATNRKTLMAGVASAALVAVAMVSTYRMSPQHAGPGPTGGYESPALPESDTPLTEEETKSADLIAPQPAPAAEPALAYLTRERSNPETAKADQMRQPMGMAGRQYDLAQDRREGPGSVPLDPTAPGWQEQGRDNFQDVESNPVKLVAEDPVSTFSVDVDTASYAFMRSSLNNNVLPPSDSVRIEEFINYFDYNYAGPADPSTPFNADISVFPSPWNTNAKLMRIGIKGYELPASNVPRSNLVFLIDTSGSMDAPDKLPLLINAFKLLLSSLKPDDTVAIVTYAGGAGTVLEPTKVADKERILTALDHLRSGGSTAGAEGIRQAYQLAERDFDQDGVNRVILATDGDFNVGITDPDELEDFVARKRDSGITLSVLGFGDGNYNDALMQRLAQNGNGNASYIDTLGEARKVLVDEAGSTLFTIAKDVKLQVEFNPAEVRDYRLIGYETRKLRREDFNNDRVDAGDIGSGHTVTALYEFTPADAAQDRIDPLRYGDRPAASVPSDRHEYAFVKIRYKLPEGGSSRLLEFPVAVDGAVDDIGRASRDDRFATAVAAFGELLRGGRYSGSFSYDDVIALAVPARGDDPYGYRSEFVNLVRMAKAAQAIQPLKQ